MQAVLNKLNQSDVQTEVATLLKRLENADNNTKNEVENSIVKMGTRAVDFLVDKLATLKGISRGVVAMSLIRIGEPAVVALKEQAQEKKEFGWIANYLISEIRGH